jgi:hypothetical protein
LFNKEQCVTTLSSVFRTIQVFISDNRSAIFKGKNTALCGDLLYQLFRHMYAEAASAL